jgi:hypothetical protein
MGRKMDGWILELYIKNFKGLMFENFLIMLLTWIHK